MIYILLYLIFFIGYAYFSKIREAYYYDIQYKINHKHKDLHSTYFKERCLFLGLFLTIILGKLNVISLLLLIPFSLLSWDFFADGFYFIFRNKLNNKVYKEKFKADESNTSTSILDKKGITKDYKSRLTYFIIGLWFLILSITLQIFN